MTSIPIIAENLRTQDNRITANPIFVVQQKVRRPVPEGYSCDGQWYDTRRGEAVTDIREEIHLSILASQGELDGDRYRWVCYVDDYVFVQPFFTEKGAEHYIKINGHNLRQPRIYVESGYRNSEWEEVREHLMGVPVGGWKS